MGTDEAAAAAAHQRLLRARTAIAAFVASAAILLVGPASIAVAAPAVGDVTSPRSVEKVRDVVGHPRLKVRGLDSLSEMGEMESLRLQMAMDRMSKLQSTLSNILKKNSEAASSITRNLK